MRNQIEGFGPEQIEPKEKQYANDEIFRAEQEGNGLLPQARTGIVVTTFAKLAEFPPDEWKRTFSSELSPEQLSQWARIMSNMHRSHDIKVSTAEHAHKFADHPSEQVRIIKEEQLQRLWTMVREALLDTIVSYGKHYYPELANKEHFENNALTPDAIAGVMEIVDAASDDLRTIFPWLRNVLLSEEGRELAKQYKSTLLERYKIQGPNAGAWNNEFDRKFTALIYKKFDEEKPPFDIEKLRHAWNASDDH